MNQFIESLCRLYQDGKVSNATLDRLLSENKISKQEYILIISVNNAT
jgi:hypothetical protein